MVKFKIKKGDLVQIVAGADRGHVGEVMKMVYTKSKAVVKGANVVKRCVSPTKDNPGHIKDKEMPVHVSNIMLVERESMKPTRVGYKYLDDGKKVRYSKRTKKEV